MFLVMDQPSPDEPPIVSAVRALRMMHEALVLLDRAGASLAACRLQHAIDTLDPPDALVADGSDTLQ